MSQKVLFVCGSPRSKGNTGTLAKVMAGTLDKLGAKVDVVKLVKLKGFGKGCSVCNLCQTKRDFRCHREDEIAPVLNSLDKYDLVVLCGPVYFFGISAQMKAFLDRFYAFCLYKGEKLLPHFTNTKFAVVATAGDTLETSGVKNLLKNYTDAMKYLGVPAPQFFFEGGCNDIDAVKENSAVQAKAVKFAEGLFAKPEKKSKKAVKK